jgi:hypothetical protein
MKPFLFWIIFASCVPYNSVKIESNVNAPVYLDPEYGWINSVGKCLWHKNCQPLQAITLRVVSRKRFNTPVLIRCCFQDNGFFGEVEMDLEPHARKIITIYGISRGLPEKITCSLAER